METNIEINGEQERAVKASTERPLQIIACPGSGKTLSLMARVKWILNSCTFQTQTKILILSFSRNAVVELLQRMNRDFRLRHHLNRIEVSTFHSVCYRILREKSSVLQLFPKSPTIIPTKIAKTLVTVAYFRFYSVAQITMS